MLKKELQIKISRLHHFMDEKKYDGVLLTSNANFHWISCGKNAFVDKSSENAVAKILITKHNNYVICNSSEKFRIMEEELTGGEFKLITYYWHENEYEKIVKYIQNKRIASDNGMFGTDNCNSDIQKLRYQLTEDEIVRYRIIGPECANILERSCCQIKKGESEIKIAARTVKELMEKGYQVPVCLVAADRRLLKYRHPIPTNNKVQKYAMIAICAQKYGLTVSISRMVCFGVIDEVIKNKYEALLKIDATYILNTVVGIKVNLILEKAYKQYVANGYEKDFHLHHQGGALGYLTRDYCVNFKNKQMVQNHQAFSWNPTIAGVKLEDTIIVFDNRQQIITQTNNWVYRDIEIDGKTIKRPYILTL